ncbi:MAG: acyl-CoA dehydrogenase family protein [Polyangiaceae bacterium]|nr:acyl-CoA dehydrogenase family protein [Polyangiaceae bacterium]
MPPAPNPPNAIGRALDLLARFAGSAFVQRHALLRPAERAVYLGTRTGFQAVVRAQRVFKRATRGDAIRLGRPGRETDLFDCDLAEEQQLMQATVGELARSVLRPAASAAEDARACPPEVRLRAAELGLMGLCVPEAHGGLASERSLLTQVIVAEALARGDMGLALALLAPLSAACALTEWGTGSQQATYLAPFTGDAPPLATIAVDEPTPLFNPYAPACRATPDGDGWRLHGDKRLVPLAGRAALWLVSASTPRGPRVFLVEAGATGVSVRPAGSMGLAAAELGDLRFDRVRLSRDALLGDDTFDHARFVDHASLGWCALATGCAQAVLDYVIPYCNEREAFGEPISHRQAVAFMVADLAIELDGLRMLAYRAASRADLGLPWHREVFLARTLAGEVAMRAGDHGVQLLGGHGYTKDHPVERWYRDLRAVAVLHGGLHL